MVTVDSFMEIRSDGRMIDEATMLDQMLDEEWGTAKVIALQWDCFSSRVDLSTPYGFLSQIVPNREYVAVLEELDFTGDLSLLSVYHADGSLVRSIPNRIEAAGLLKVGFLWFEEPVSLSPTAFSLVASIPSTGGTCQVDFDAVLGSVLNVTEIR